MGTDSSTQRFGVFGDPIAHTKSPVMHNAAFQALGINGNYTAFHVKPADLKQAVQGIRDSGLRGVNVTIPHKLAVMEWLDVIDEGARIIGAVNTIVNDDGELKGYNTDGIGYVRSLKEECQIELTGKRIVIIGAGGAARGVAYALCRERPEHIWIANRTIERANELAQSLQPYGKLSGMGMDGLADIKNEADIVINTTSVGMHPHVADRPADPAQFNAGTIISDLIYNPLRTRWLQEAETRGCIAHGGLGMFVYQGAYAFEYWTGKPAPIDAMRTAVMDSLEL